jgi:biotin carboxyl carrier protein
VTVDEEDRQTIARLTAEVVPALIERLARSELGELEVREQGWRIRLRRPFAGYSAAVNAAATTAHVAAGAHKPAAIAGHAGADGHAGRREPDRGLITSPAVGYFMPRDGVSAGANLRGGDIVGHVDVLGVRQEVLATVDGILAKVEVEAGQAVEYGQPIAHTEPAAGPGADV